MYNFEKLAEEMSIHDAIGLYFRLYGTLPESNSITFSDWEKARYLRNIVKISAINNFEIEGAIIPKNLLLEKMAKSALTVSDWARLATLTFKHDQVYFEMSLLGMKAQAKTLDDWLTCIRICKQASRYAPELYAKHLRGLEEMFWPAASDLAKDDVNSWYMIYAATEDQRAHAKCIENAKTVKQLMVIYNYALERAINDDCCKRRYLFQAKTTSLRNRKSLLQQAERYTEFEKNRAWQTVSAAASEFDDFFTIHQKFEVCWKECDRNDDWKLFHSIAQFTLDGMQRTIQTPMDWAVYVTRGWFRHFPQYWDKRNANYLEILKQLQPEGRKENWLEAYAYLVSGKCIIPEIFFVIDEKYQGRRKLRGDETQEALLVLKGLVREKLATAST